MEDLGGVGEAFRGAATDGGAARRDHHRSSRHLLDIARPGRGSVRNISHIGFDDGGQRKRTTAWGDAGYCRVACGDEAGASTGCWARASPKRRPIARYRHFSYAKVRYRGVGKPIRWRDGGDSTSTRDQSTPGLRQSLPLDLNAMDALMYSSMNPRRSVEGVDQSVDAFTLTIGGNELEKIIAETKAHSTGLANINGILRILFGEQEIRLVRMGRNYRNRKLQIARENTVFLPSLDSLSTGQSTLLSIFGTILRYADTGVMSCPTTQMTGLVLIDEVDAHLHSELQLEALPNLMTLFPNVQFIISCHSPFVALGMERAYGEENLQIIELPDGKRIRAERFGELIQYFEALRQTDIFEDEVSEKVRELKRPVVICEGQTDSKYFETAANLLGYDKLSREVDFDWVGTVSDGRAVDGGKDRLKQAVKLLQNNPKLCRTPVVVLFDCDTDEDPFDSNALHVRVLQRNEQNEKCDTGVENLLPDSAFEERFFVVKEIKRGANRTTIRELNKSALCDYLCKEKRDPKDFERFGETLDILEELLVGVRAANAK